MLLVFHFMSHSWNTAEICQALLCIGWLPSIITGFRNVTPTPSTVSQCNLSVFDLRERETGRETERAAEGADLWNGFYLIFLTFSLPVWVWQKSPVPSYGSGISMVSRTAHTTPKSCLSGVMKALLSWRKSNIGLHNPLSQLCGWAILVLRFANFSLFIPFYLTFFINPLGKFFVTAQYIMVNVTVTLLTVDDW